MPVFYFGCACCFEKGTDPFLRLFAACLGGKRRQARTPILQLKRFNVRLFLFRDVFKVRDLVKLMAALQVTVGPRVLLK